VATMQRYPAPTGCLWCGYNGTWRRRPMRLRSNTKVGSKRANGSCRKRRVLPPRVDRQRTPQQLQVAPSASVKPVSAIRVPMGWAGASLKVRLSGSLQREPLSFTDPGFAGWRVPDAAHGWAPRPFRRPVEMPQYRSRRSLKSSASACARAGSSGSPPRLKARLA
jgi:hypothetical protein